MRACISATIVLRQSDSVRQPRAARWATSRALAAPLSGLRVPSFRAGGVAWEDGSSPGP